VTIARPSSHLRLCLERGPAPSRSPRGDRALQRAPPL